MSTTIQQTLDQLEQRRDRPHPGRVHERYLWTNPETCNECYARLREIVEYERNAWGHTTEERRRSDSGVLGYDDDRGETSMHPATFCEECGGRGRAHPETDSKRQAVRRGARIVDRLEEQSIPVDRVALITAVRQLKSDGRIEAFDREIYARATKLGVEYGRD